MLIPLCLIVFLVASSPAIAQSPLPSCEPSSQLQEALKTESDWKLPSGQTLDRLLARHRKILTDLILKYPREIEPHRRLILESTKKPFPAFELADLSGQVWRLKDLAGKSLLIKAIIPSK
jgi:hypothetical protein